MELLEYNLLVLLLSIAAILPIAIDLILNNSNRRKK
jgi:hypothetical protein